MTSTRLWRRPTDIATIAPQEAGDVSFKRIHRRYTRPSHFQVASEALHAHGFLEPPVAKAIKEPNPRHRMIVRVRKVGVEYPPRTHMAEIGILVEY